MGLFKGMLGSEESIFKNDNALDFEFIPKLLPYRENEQKYVATCIKPLFVGTNGRNLFIYGAPGIGKTAAIKHVFRDLEYETEEVIPIYVNCWQKNTSFKVLLEICEQLGYRLTHNKKTEELFRVIKQMLSKKAAVFAFDEVDKLEDEDFLYMILEEVYHKSIFLLTNFEEWILDMDDRIKSRMLPEKLEFKRYNDEEMRGILEERRDYAFIPNSWSKEAFDTLVSKVAPASDVRKGLYLMRQAGISAELASSKTVEMEHLDSALEKMTDFTIKKSTDLDDETRFVLEIVKKNSGDKIGDLFKKYQEAGGKGQYKTFQRKVKKLLINKFITVKKLVGGAQGSTTIVKYEPEKKLTDY